MIEFFDGTTFRLPEWYQTGTVLFMATDYSTHPHFESEEAADAWWSAQGLCCPSCDRSIPDDCTCDGDDE